MIGRAVLVAGLLVLASCRDETAQVPAVHEVTLAELPATLASHRGTPLLVNFWAMWCSPCVAELPDVVAVAHDFGRRGGTVIGVSMDPTDPRSELDAVRRRLPDFLPTSI